MTQLLKFIFAATALVSFTGMSAQSISKTHSLKAYANFAYSNESKNEMFFKENMIRSYESRYDLGYFTPAFAFHNENGNFHELEISRIKFGSEAYYLYENLDNINYSSKKIRANTINISFRYEYADKINKGNEESKLSLYIGVSGNPYYLNENFASTTTTTVFPQTQSQMGIAIGLVPRITYNITPNWFLDLNIPVSLVDFALIRFKIDNPMVYVDHRELKSSELVLFPSNVLLRFGVGLKI